MTDLQAELIDKLDVWIDLLRDPASYHSQYWPKKLSSLRNEILINVLNAKGLISGGIWGGMGSLLDSAGINPAHFVSLSDPPELRKKAWEQASKYSYEWNTKFHLATISLGELLISHFGDDPNIRLVKDKIEFSKTAFDYKYQAITPKQIDRLESAIKNGFL